MTEAKLSDRQHLALLVARLGMASLFLFSGAEKLIDRVGAAGFAASFGVPFASYTVPLAGLLEIVAALMIVTGWHARSAAVALAVWMTVLNPWFHPFWTLPPGQMWQLIVDSFFHHFVMIGGMIYLAVFGPGRYRIGSAPRVTAAVRPKLGPLPYIVGGCMFMENLDATVIVTALPAMARDFGVEPTTLSLGISAYLVALAVCLPLSPWLSDRFGSRTIVCAGIALFTLTSLLCGLSNGLPAFVAARVAQGTAAALMSPSGRLAVLRDTPKERLAHVIAVFTWPALIAPLLGPPFGGFLTSYASWHWIFFLNLPVGALGLLLAWRYVPQRRAAPPPFDALGFVLIGTALAALVLGLELASGAGDRTLGAAMLGAGILLAVAAVRHLRRAAYPLVGLRAAAIPSFAATTLTGGTLSRLAVSATPFLLPLLFQTVFGLSAFAAGSMMLGYFAGNLGMKLLTTAALRRWGFRDILIGNGALLAAVTALCALAGFEPPVVAITAAMLVAGASRSLQFTALNTLTFADVPPGEQAHAHTLNSLSQQIAAMLGVALAASLLNLGMTARGADVLAGSDFALAFGTLAILAAGAVGFYRRLLPGTGAQVSGARRSQPVGNGP